MFDMFLNTLKLFLRGKLFRDPKAVMKKWLIGCAAAFFGFVILALIGTPIWLAVLVAALGTGVMQPYLFKDLKYN